MGEMQREEVLKLMMRMIEIQTLLIQKNLLRIGMRSNLIKKIL